MSCHELLGAVARGRAGITEMRDRRCRVPAPGRHCMMCMYSAHFGGSFSQFCFTRSVWMKARVSSYGALWYLFNGIDAVSFKVA